MTNNHLYQLEASVESLHQAFDLEVSQEGIVDTVRKLVPSVVKDFIAYIRDLQTAPTTLRLTHPLEEINQVTAKVNYVEMKPLAIMKPETMGSDYETFSKAVLAAVQEAKQVDRILDEFVQFLGVLVSHRESLMATRDLFAGYDSVKSYNSKREAAIQAISKLTANNQLSTTTYGKAFKNHQGLAYSYQAIQEACESMNRVNRSELTKKMKIAADLLSEFNRKVKAGEVDHISDKVVLEVADVSLAIAHYLEFFSFTYFQVMSLSLAFNDACATILKTYQE